MWNRSPGLCANVRLCARVYTNGLHRLHSLYVLFCCCVILCPFRCRCRQQVDSLCVTYEMIKSTQKWYRSRQLALVAYSDSNTQHRRTPIEDWFVRIARKKEAANENDLLAAPANELKWFLYLLKSLTIDCHGVDCRALSVVRRRKKKKNVDFDPGHIFYATQQHSTHRSSAISTREHINSMRKR